GAVEALRGDLVELVDAVGAAPHLEADDPRALGDLGLGGLDDTARGLGRAEPVADAVLVGQRDRGVDLVLLPGREPGRVALVGRGGGGGRRCGRGGRAVVLLGAGRHAGAGAAGRALAGGQAERLLVAGGGRRRLAGGRGGR